MYREFDMNYIFDLPFFSNLFPIIHQNRKCIKTDDLKTLRITRLKRKFWFESGWTFLVFLTKGQ